MSTDASDEDVDEDSTFARIGSSKTGAAARRASSKRKALAAKSAKIRVSGSGAQEADTARARRALTPAWTAEADSILVRAYAKVSKNQKEKIISWQAVAEILAEGGRPGTTDSAARSRWGYVLKTHSTTMVKGTAVLDRVAALIKAHALPPLAKKVKFKGPTTRGKVKQPSNITAAAAAACVRNGGGGSSSAGTRPGTTFTWTREMDSVLVLSYQKLTTNMMNIKKHIRWDAVPALLEDVRTGSSKVEAKQRWNELVSMQKQLMSTGRKVPRETIVVDALIAAHVDAAAAAAVDAADAAAAAAAAVDAAATKAARKETRAKGKRKVSADVAAEAWAQANQKAFEEGWTSDTKAHPLIGKRIARQFLNAAEATYGNIVASLSPDASGENEWYFVHWMDDGDMEELEVYEIKRVWNC